MLFREYVAQDDKNSAKMAFEVSQGGLGMPNRGYYFKTDTTTAVVRRAYSHYLFLTFEQLGADSAKAMEKANGVLQLETHLAKASRELADLRDPYKNYNKMDVAALQKLMPGFGWAVYLHQAGADDLDSVIVGQPEFLVAVNKELSKAPLQSWKDYFSFHLVLRAAPYLDSQTLETILNIPNP